MMNMDIMKIFSRYNPPPAVNITVESDSPVQQQFLEETQLDYLLKKYSTLGINPFVASGEFDYLDTTLLPDFQTMQNKVVQIKEYFSGLPSDLRRRFGDNVDNFVQFVQDPANSQALIDLGLVEAQPAQPVEPDVTPPLKEAPIVEVEKSAQLPT